MLVLSRKINEEIIIAGEIVVKVIAVRGNTVRLGILAPADTPITRPKDEKNVSTTGRKAA